MSTFNILHPHHVFLPKSPHNFSSLLHQWQDRISPYSDVDSRHSLRDVIAPRFDVWETEFAYLLDGEVPGIGDRSQISVEWLENQTLYVRGVIKPETEYEKVLPFDIENTMKRVESMLYCRQVLFMKFSEVCSA
jgi:HSP20 family molecular chaperone IbpA